jgi:glutamate N-acetyltransferase/amino-acid N-acetyltransferase
MIEPNMATMLAFLTTDAAVDAKALQDCLSAAVADSFNRITIDGDQSCNDTVLLLANGLAGNNPLGPKHPEWKTFCAAVTHVTKELAMKIVLDGEGATKFVSVIVKGAASDADAKKAARAVANSLLVKTAWFGCDPNWGRIIDAVGYSGARIVEEKTNIRFDALFAVRNGRRAAGVELKDLEAIYRQKSFTVEIDLRLGKCTDTVFTCDCSHEYVRINSEYMT